MTRNDYRSLDLGLGDTADAIRDSVRSFAVNEIAPLADDIDRTDQFPPDLSPWLFGEQRA